MLTSTAQTTCRQELALLQVWALTWQKAGTHDTSYLFGKLLVLEKFNTGSSCRDDDMTNKQVSVLINKLDS